MKIQDYIVPFFLAILTTWAFQQFFLKKTPVDQHRFVAPQSAVECQPLQKTVNFTETKPVASPVITSVVTEWGNLEFTTDGATLNRLEFNRHIDGSSQTLGTIYPPERQEKNNRAFLVALDNATPFNYKLEEFSETAESATLVYEGSSSAGRIVKTFVVNKQKNQVDLKIALDPRDETAVRVLYPAPLLPALVGSDAIAAEVIDGSGTVSRIGLSELKPDEGWVSPSMFGVEDKYFLHTMIKDTDNFTQRAYLNTDGKAKLTAILEGPVVNKDTTWTISFYLGPKEVHAMEAVDSQLGQFMDYSLGMGGWIWSPISRLLLLILNWLNGLVHNYGIAILLLTILARLILVPFSLRGEQGMKGQADRQKRLKYIEQKYKDDPQAKMQAQSEFMREHGLGLGSCLPMLLQMPIFFGLSRVLQSSIELYKAPFLWISDLSAPDPYYILPVLVMLSMLYSAFSMPNSQQRMPMVGMALVFGAVSASMSAGLVLYISFSTVVNVVQTKLFKFLRLV